MYLESFLAETSTGADAWNAIYKKGQERNFGTSKQDIDDYAAAGGAVAAGAACAAAGQPEAAPLCAAIGGAIAGALADALQTIGASLFSSGGGYKGPDEVWNPVADSAIKGIVKALRVQNGQEVSDPPGGSFRNYPEWDPVAVAWAQRVNVFVASKGVPIKWFYDSASDENPGRIRGDAIPQWTKICYPNLQPSGSGTVPGKYQQINLAPTAACWTTLAPLPEATTRATQETAAEMLSSRGWGRGPGTASTTSKVVKFGALAAAAGLAWYFRQPILAFASGILKR